MQKAKSAKEFLDYLNKEYSKLHTAYEKNFWLSYMGDHSVDKAMNKAQAARDAFRADPKLKAETEQYMRMAKGEIKRRLGLWDHFFSLYQAPAHAAAIKDKVSALEAKIAQKRSSRKEGYLDPKSGKFVPASENKMRSLMRTHPDEAIRKACFESMEKLPLSTLDDYIKIIGLRNEFARAVGYSDFYEYKLRIDEDMSKKELFPIFEAIYQKTKYAFKNVREIEKEKPGLRKPWNFGYMMTGEFTKEEDQYFQFENAISYWGRSFAALGIDFKGGAVTLDLLDRKGKHNNGFCHYTDLVRYEKGKRLPGSADFSSNAIPGQIGSGAQGIHTVFHEGGHAADRLNSLQEDVCINSEYPPSTISWAETHSMFMDTMASSIEWCMRYAKNAAGEAYPFSHFEKKLRALHPLYPLELMGIIYVVFFEKEIYECKNLTKNFVLKTARKVYQKYFDRTGESISILNVPHIYSWESSAYYHGYGLAELGVHQWREYFLKKYGYIVDNPNVGREITKMWSYASMYPAKKLVKMATGKKLGPEAFIRNATKTLGGALTDAKSRIARLEKVPFYKKPVNLKGTITMVHGKKKITDNRKSFEDMDAKYRAWLATL